jgi:glutathione S-transferase
MLRLISARPSPFARKVRVALIEKGIPFETVVDVPWNPDTLTPAHNPLAQAPVLILDNGLPVYDSRVIVEYLEVLAPEPRLVPEEPVHRLAHKQVEALADGVCDAAVLAFLERSRAPAQQSLGWTDRQLRKVTAGVAVADRILGDGEVVVAPGFGLADVRGRLHARLPRPAPARRSTGAAPTPPRPPRRPPGRAPLVPRHAPGAPDRSAPRHERPGPHLAAEAPAGPPSRAPAPGRP